MLPFGQHGGIVGSAPEQMGGKGHGQCHLAAACRTAEHKGVWQTLFVHHLEKPLLGFLLSYHLLESRHSSRLAISTTESTADTV